ncbi:movement protein [Siratro latent polerovirus]|uniref:Movement protein n=1 Tax=Siratro latent polerovirus TaxID=2562543 RepID=A0A565DCN5_9VIRU|nr:movement protein [Siratro latent polerovirus]
MAWEDADGVTGAMQGASAWLWSKPLGSHDADEDNDETADALIEEAELEGDARAKHLYFQKTISRAVPPEVSPSGRLWQRSQSSVLEYSRPTMNIRSQWSSWSSSPRPPQLPQVPSLMSWTPIANTAPFNPRLINLESPRTGREVGLLGSSTGWNGTTHPKINAESSTRETALRRLRAPSGSPLGANSKTPNR